MSYNDTDYSTDVTLTVLGGYQIVTYKMYMVKYYELCICNIKTNVSEYLVVLKKKATS